MGFRAPLAADMIEQVRGMAGVLMVVSVSDGLVGMSSRDMMFTGALPSFGDEHFVGLEKHLYELQVEATFLDHIAFSVAQFWIEL